MCLVTKSVTIARAVQCTNSLGRNVLAEEALIEGEQSGAGVVSNVDHQALLDASVIQLAGILDVHVERSAGTVRLQVGIVGLMRRTHGQRKKNIQLRNAQHQLFRNATTLTKSTSSVFCGDS